MGGSTDMKFKLALGSASSTFLNLCNVTDIFYVFDQGFDRFCKSFTKRAWKLRSELKSQLHLVYGILFCTTFVAAYCIK